MTCRSVSLSYTLFEGDKRGLTCGTPCIRSGCDNGCNYAEIDEQVEFEFHLRCGRGGGEEGKEGEGEGTAPFMSQTGRSGRVR